MPEPIFLLFIVVIAWSAYDKGKEVGAKQEQERIEAQQHPLHNMTRHYASKRHPVIQAAIYERVTDITVSRRCDILVDESATEYETLIDKL